MHPHRPWSSLILALAVAAGAVAARGDCTPPAPPTISVTQEPARDAGSVVYRAMDATVLEVHTPWQPCNVITWDFGDGSPLAYGSGVSHLFPAGTYDVQVTVENPAGKTSAHLPVTFLNSIWVSPMYPSSCTEWYFIYPVYYPCFYEGNDLRFKVRRSVASGPATVHYATAAVTGSHGEVMRAPSEGTIAFAGGALESSISLPSEDDRCGGWKYVFVDFSISSPSNETTLPGPGPLRTWARVLNNDCPGVSIEPPQTICKDSETKFLLRRTNDIDQGFTMHWYAFTGWGTLHGQPVMTGGWAQGTVTFEPMQEVTELVVPKPFQTGEKILGLSGYGGETYRRFSVTNEEEISAVTAESAFAVEGDHHLTFTVRRAAASPCRLFVTLVAHGGSAQKDVDFVSGYERADFAPGSLSTTFTVPLLDDVEIESDETFHLYRDSDGARLATGTILDNDYRFDPARLMVPKGATAAPWLDAGWSSLPRVVALTSADPEVAQVPAEATLPATGSGGSLPVMGHGLGKTKVYATMRGNTLPFEVWVYQPSTLRIAPQPVAATAGSTLQVTLTLDPPPAQPMSLSPAVADETIATVPAWIALPESGSVTFPLHARKRGATTLTIVLPPSHGSVVHTARVEVAPAEGAPLIDVVEPLMGSSAGGTPVRIRGRNLRRDCSVSFGGLPVSATRFIDAASLTAVTPPQPGGWADVVLHCGHESDALPAGFLFQDLEPSLDSLQPAFGNVAGGTLVRATGRNIRQDCGLFFGGIPARGVTIPWPDEMIAAVPPHPTGPVDVTLRCGDSMALLPGAYTFTAAEEPAASIASIEPLSAAPGQLVTIRGARFRNDRAVSFGDDGAAIEATAPDWQTVTLPDLPPGEVDVRVGDTIGPRFTVLETIEPQIAAVSPAAGAAGSEIAVDGQGFRAGAAFTIAGMPLDVVRRSFQQAVLRIPQEVPPGSYTIDAGATTGPQFDVTEDGPRLRGVAPACSPTSGAIEVTIDGSGLAAGSAVTFGGVPAVRAWLPDDGRIVAVLPPNLIGPSQIAVTSPDGRRATLTGAMRYVSPLDGSGCP